MKKKIKPILIFIVAGLLFFLVYKINTQLIYKQRIEKRVKLLPNFSFNDTEGKIFTQDSLKNKPTIFIYFNSECDYCKVEVKKIQENIDKFYNTQLVFVSYESLPIIRDFAKHYKLHNVNNIKFLEDKKGVFSKIFDVKTIPFIVIYNDKKQLKRKIKGITTINEILNELKS